MLEYLHQAVQPSDITSTESFQQPVLFPLVSPNLFLPKSENLTRPGPFDHKTPEMSPPLLVSASAMASSSLGSTRVH